MKKALSGDTVQVHYTGKLEDGTVFDSSRQREPLSFELGASQVIPGFEKAVIGLEVGESRSVHIPMEEGYGPYHQELLSRVERKDFPEEITPEVGLPLEAHGQDGQTMRVVITEVDEESILLDANHPLAGKALNFEVELVAFGAGPEPEGCCGGDGGGCGCN